MLNIFNQINKQLKQWIDPNKPLNRNHLFYLASPYTHKSKLVEKERLNMISKIAALLLQKDIKGIYPISSSVEVAKHLGHLTTFEHWKDLDYLYIEKTDGIIVANMPGWRTSTGVTAEIKHAIKIGLPVYILNTRNLIEKNKLNLRKIA